MEAWHSSSGMGLLPWVIAGMLCLGLQGMLSDQRDAACQLGTPVCAWDAICNEVATFPMVLNHFFSYDFLSEPLLLPVFLCLSLLSEFLKFHKQELNVQHTHFNSYSTEPDALRDFGSRVLKLGSQKWLVLLACDCLQVGLPGSSLSPVRSPGFAVPDLSG